MECCTNFLTGNWSICQKKEVVPLASKARQKAVIRYTKNNYDRLEARAPKGQGEEVKAHAKRNGESLNAFLLRAIQETMQRDKEKTT